MSTRRNRAALALAGLGVVATCVLAAGIGPASADPNPATPGTPVAGKTDDQLVAGIGADADAELIDAIVADYNGRSGATDPSLESYDAVDPVTGATPENITTKPGCTISRANGANAGATELLAGQKADTTKGADDGTALCADFARMSRSKKTDGSEAGLDFFALTTDAVTWAAVTGSYAPASLSAAQLKNIFECTTTDWSQVGGQAGPIHVYVPPASAATYTFFLQAIGSSTAAVTQGCGSQAIPAQQNDGTSIKGDPQGIAPYAIGKYASQENTADNPTAGIAVRDVRGGAVLGSATATTGGTPVAPTVTNGNYQVVNTAFTPAFTRTLFDATLNGNGSLKAPTYFTPNQAAAVFGSGGFVCTDPTVQSTFAAYGFAPLTGTGTQPACGAKS